MVTIDIARNRVGVFEIGQIFELPDGLCDDNKREVDENDLLEIEAYQGVSVLVGVQKHLGKLVGETFQIVVNTPTEAALYGVPLARARLHDVLHRLKADEIQEFRNGDSVLTLDNGSALGVLLDDIDMVRLGASRWDVCYPSDSITDPVQKSLVLRAASNATKHEEQHRENEVERQRAPSIEEHRLRRGDTLRLPDTRPFASPLPRAKNIRTWSHLLHESLSWALVVVVMMILLSPFFVTIKGYPLAGPYLGLMAVCVITICIVNKFRADLRRKRQARRYRGECLYCGYDLRGNVSDVCPECGSSVSLHEDYM